MSIYGFVYIIGTLLVPHIPVRFTKQFTLMSSCFMMGIFLFLVGPSKLMGFNESLTLILVGLFITANFLAPLVIPVLPEMLDAIKDKVGACDEQTAGNYTGALLNTSLGLGQVLGPLFGATTYAALGWQSTQDIVAIICIVFSAIYFTFANGKAACSQTLRGGARR